MNAPDAVGYLASLLVLAACGDLDVRTVRVPEVVPAPLEGEWTGTWTSDANGASGPLTVRVQEFGGEPLLSVDIVNACVENRAYDLVLGNGLIELRDGQRTVFERGLLDTLRKRELDAVGAKIAGETGLAYRPAATGEKVAGVVRQRLALASGRFAMIDDGLGFRLVPWVSTLEQQLGRQVAGVVRAGGGIDWTLGRKRGLGL